MRFEHFFVNSNRKIRDFLVFMAKIKINKEDSFKFSTGEITVSTGPAGPVPALNHDTCASSYDLSDHILAPTNLSSTGTLSFRDLKYTLHDTRIDDRRRKYCSSCLKPPSSKWILHKVSGIFSSGMNAILGKYLMNFTHLRKISNRSKWMWQIFVAKYFSWSKGYSRPFWWNFYGWFTIIFFIQIYGWLCCSRWYYQWNFNYTRKSNVFS